MVVASSDGEGKSESASSDESEALALVDSIGYAISFIDRCIKW